MVALRILGLRVPTATSIALVGGTRSATSAPSPAALRSGVYLPRARTRIVCIEFDMGAVAAGCQKTTAEILDHSGL
jgi:hypothetical protein